MTKYQFDLMALIRYNNPELTIEELEKQAIELYNKIHASLEENRERTNKQK